MRIITIFLITCITAASCKTEKRYRTESGLMYTIYPSNSKDSIARMGQTVKVHYLQKAGDSIIDQNYDRMPLYYMVMPGYGNKYNPLEVFDYGLKKGDSVVTIQLVDSMMKKRIFDSLPPWLHKDDQWTTYFKVVDIFTNDSLLQADKQKEMMRVMFYHRSNGPTRIAAYLKEKHISYIKANDSVFVEKVKSSQQVLLDSGEAIKAIITAKTLKGKTINPADTVSFISGKGFFPAIIEGCFKYITKPSITRLYFPAIFLFGPEPTNKDVKANDDLVFEIEVLQ